MAGKSTQSNFFAGTPRLESSYGENYSSNGGYSASLLLRQRLKFIYRPFAAPAGMFVRRDLEVRFESAFWFS